MKNKKFIFIVIGVLIIFTISSYAETKKLKELGRYTLVRIKGQVPSSDVMKVLVDKYAGDIKYGFDKAGYSDLFIPFMDQIKKANFVEKDLPVGTHFMWMLFRSAGRVKLVEDLEWAGKAPLPVYSFILNKDYKNYEIIMPRPCGNISLMNIEEVIPDAICDIKVTPVKANINDPISVDMSGSQHAKSMQVEVFDADGVKVNSKSLTPDSPMWQTKFDKCGEYTFKATAFNIEDKPSVNACDAKTYINCPPLCKIWTSCLPCLDYVGKPITIDANNSTDPDGKIAKVDFEITDAAGSIVDTFSDTTEPFTWEKIFNKAGIYTISAVVTDDFGAMSDPCTPLEVEVTEKRFFFLVEAGPMLSKGTFTLYGFVRAGIFYKIVPNTFSLAITAGPAFPFANTHSFKTYFTVNGLLNFHADRIFIGAGAGYTSKDQDSRESGIDLIGQIGVDIFSSYKTTGSIFAEGRLPIGSNRPSKDLLKLGLGFRMLF
ncbi:MAG: hypothetical protein KAX11_00470 [Candidatus Aminicenantes bacterium]|nr:hypothetical protein [Candidatus Aminicenantes bacterium]